MTSKNRADNKSAMSITKGSNHTSIRPSPFKNNKDIASSATKNVHIQNVNNFDAELLYQFRAKSVIKRREEL